MNSLYLYTLIPTVAFYGVSFFSPNNKVFIGIFLLYVLVMWAIHKRWQDVILFSYMASLPLAAGKKIPFDLVSFREFNLLTFRPYGISADVIVTVGDVCILFMAVVVLKDIIFNRRWEVYKDVVATALFSFFAAMSVATAFGSLRPEISYLHSLFLLKPLVLYWYLKHQIDRRIVWKYGMFIILAAILLESGVAVIQVIKQGPIGSVLELAPDYIPYDTSSDSGQVFRPVGTFYHANTLAHFLLPLLLLIIPFFFYHFRHVPTSLIIATGIIGMGTFFLTQSRSAWVSFFIGFVTYLALIEKVWHLPVRLTSEAKRVGTWFILPMTIVLFIFVVPRILRTSYTLDRYGSFQTRILLLEEAALAAREHPIYGVGLEMDLFSMYLRSVHRRVTNGVIFFFPEPVHNGYMRVLLQGGLVGLGGFAIACFFILREIRTSAGASDDDGYRHAYAGAVAGVVAILLNSTMQPLVPNLHDMLLLIILSGAYQYPKNLTNISL